MKRNLFILLISLVLVSCGQCSVKYTVYIPSENKFAEFVHREGATAFELSAGDTVITIDGKKAVVICH